MTLISIPLQSNDTEQLSELLRFCIETQSAELLYERIKSSSPEAIALAFRQLSNNDCITVWVLLSSQSPKFTANLLDLFTDNELLVLFRHLPLEITIELFKYLPSVDRRLLMSQLPRHLQSQLKLALPQKWRNEERAALIYPEYSAGGICKNEIIKLHEQATVADLNAALQEMELSTEERHSQAPNSEELNSEHLEWRYIYLRDDKKTFVGALRLRDVFLQSPDTPLKQHIDPSIPVAQPELELFALKSILDTTQHPVIPVVNEYGFQIGTVGFKQVNEALYEQSNHQLLEQSGVFGGDEFRTMSTITRNLRRLAFLLPSVVLSYAAVSIIAAFEPIIEQIAVLAAILPLVANLSGAAGNQAVAVSIRELSVGHLSAKDVFYVVSKEIPIGLINGILIGILLAVLTLLTHGSEHIGLPLLIGAAYAFSSTLAVIIGGTLPLFLRRLSLDPAMLSSPVLTTLTDAISFFSVLYLAQLFLL
ncbi:magnesium transporter [Photobacterium sp. BZF1]|uniref:magnesium transporter n=1 Tax=Photobacterium sp. BZF1 TaxID=1904457 RepID=UPI001653D3F8|nr:magnesium transporter [Photobacterium sp. BZF1]MBC7006708.1 magnesium transporter [Photobacterium sp. BZF1]